MSALATSSARDTRASFEHSPYAYARHLAGYISNASTIRAHTMCEFDRSPPIEIIERMMAEARAPIPQRRDMAEDRDWPDDDGLPWRPRGLVRLEPPKPPVDALEQVSVQAVLEDIADAPDPVTPREIIAAIAALYGVKFAEVIGPSRARNIVRARNAAVHVLKQRGNSTPRVGGLLGGRDHSTILNSCRQFELRATESDWAIVRQFYKVERVEAVE